MEQQPPPQMMPEAFPPMAMPVSEKADLLDKIKPDLIVEVIRHKLMGEVEVNGAWVKLKTLQERAISETGAWDISNLMLSVSNQNVALSKLKDHEIRARSLAIAKQAIKMCLKNWKEYNIKGTDQLGFIHQIVFSNTFITLKQPENGGIRDLIKNTRTESISHVSQGKPKGDGWFRR